MTRDTRQKIYILALNFAIQVFRIIFKITFVSRIAYKHAHDLKLTEHKFYFESLPLEFDGYKILFLTDIHADKVQNIEARLLEIIDRVEFDICTLGGDYAHRYKGKNIQIVKNFASNLIARIKFKGKEIYGILGNHDIYAFGQFLEESGVKMLINESVKIEKNKACIYLSGIDDASYYRTHDFYSCEEGIDTVNPFKILLSHTPDTYKQADKFHYLLSLNGHTHGGQICLPGGIPVVTNTKAPRRMAKGYWKFKGLQGITSNGIGCSGFTGRLFCPPEVITITLKRASE
ncbi:MAG: metallophosphoesterase [Lentisphaerota bacterium]